MPELPVEPPTDFRAAWHRRAWNRWLAARISARRDVSVDGRLWVNGRPLIDLREGGRLELGDGVLLNSSNRGYHLNLHAPVKLFADRPGALIRIGSGTRVHGSCIHAYQAIEVGERCLIAANCQIMDGSGHDLALDEPARRGETCGMSSPVRIHDDVWLGTGTIVLPGVEIGTGSVVAAGSVVTKDIPAQVLAGGNPARVLGAADQPG